MGTDSLTLSDNTELQLTIPTKVGAILVSKNVSLANVSPPGVASFVALNPGTDGQVLTADSTQPLGINWEDAGSGTPEELIGPNGTVDTSGNTGSGIEVTATDGQGITLWASTNTPNGYIEFAVNKDENTYEYFEEGYYELTVQGSGTLEMQSSQGVYLSDDSGTNIQMTNNNYMSLNSNWIEITIPGYYSGIDMQETSFTLYTPDGGTFTISDTNGSTGTSGQVLTSNGSGNATWQTPSGGSGTVTSVQFADTSTTPIYGISGGPITTYGQINQTLTTQQPNTVFAGPTSGGASQPSFRGLTQNDLGIVYNYLTTTYSNSTTSATNIFTGITTKANHSYLIEWKFNAWAPSGQSQFQITGPSGSTLVNGMRSQTTNPEDINLSTQGINTLGNWSVNGSQTTNGAVTNGWAYVTTGSTTGTLTMGAANTSGTTSVGAGSWIRITDLTAIGAIQN